MVLATASLAGKKMVLAAAPLAGKKMVLAALPDGGGELHGDQLGGGNSGVVGNFCFKGL